MFNTKFNYKCNYLTEQNNLQSLLNIVDYQKINTVLLLTLS